MEHVGGGGDHGGTANVDCVLRVEAPVCFGADVGVDEGLEVFPQPVYLGRILSALLNTFTTLPKNMYVYTMCAQEEYDNEYNPQCSS